MYSRYKYDDDVYHWICNQITTKGVTSGAGTVYPSGAPEFTPCIQWGPCFLIFCFLCMLCRSLFVHFILVIVLSGLFRNTDSDYPFGIFKLFLGGLLLFMLSNYISPAFRSVYTFLRINDVRFDFTFICVVGGSCFMFFVFMQVHCMQLSNTTSMSYEEPGGSMSQVAGLFNNSYNHISNTMWVRAGFVNYKMGALDSQRK